MSVIGPLLTPDMPESPVPSNVPEFQRVTISGDYCAGVGAVIETVIAEHRMTILQIRGKEPMSQLSITMRIERWQRISSSLSIRRIFSKVVCHIISFDLTRNKLQ